LLLIVMFYVLFMCKYVLPPGVNPTAVDKYIISYLLVNEILLILENTKMCPGMVCVLCAVHSTQHTHYTWT
jgi:hypothetical protein